MLFSSPLLIRIRVEMKTPLLVLAMLASLGPWPKDSAVHLQKPDLHLYPVGGPNDHTVGGRLRQCLDPGGLPGPWRDHPGGVFGL